MSAAQFDSRTWRWDRGSMDHLTSVESPDGLLLRGEHANAHYWVFADATGTPQWLRVLHQVGDDRISRIDLERKNGFWRHKSGAIIEGSESVLDVDLACTAATNTLAIRRLDLAVGEIADITVLYITVPALEPRLMRQRYFRHRGGYTYENLDSGFRARLTVDDAGWVKDYPGVCTLLP